MKNYLISTILYLFSTHAIASQLDLSLSTSSVKDLEIHCLGTDENAPLKGLSLRGELAEVMKICRKSGVIKAARIIPDSHFSYLVESELKPFFIKSGKVDGKNLSLPLIEQVKMNIDDGQLYLYSLVKYGPRLRFRGWGELNYLPNKNELKIRLNKAKLGYFPVTRALFFTLSRLKIKGLRVHRPFIHIELKDILF